MVEKQFTVVKLYFKSGLHLSLGKRDNYDRSQLRLHSDTLKSALFVTALKLFPELLEEIDGQEKPEDRYPKQSQFFQQFRISSGFPFLETVGNTLYFLPKPMDGFHLDLSQSTEDRKLLGKIQYVEKDTLVRIFKGELSLNDLSHLSIDRKFFAFGSDLQKKQIFRNTIQQHVAIPRGGNDDGNPFSVDKIFFEEGAGLYFLVETNDDKVVEKLKAVVKLLGDTGLGTDKTMGGGQFTFKFAQEPFIWPLSKDIASMQMNISLYWPQAGELPDLSRASYKLIRRGGFIASPYNYDHQSIRKRSVYMFEEGAVFPEQLALNGRIGDLRPKSETLANSDVPPVNHPVWRDGQAIFLPF